MRYFPITCTHRKSGICALALTFSVACQNIPQSYEKHVNASENLPQDISDILTIQRDEENTPEILQAYSAEEIVNDSNSISLVLMNLKANHGVHLVEGAYKIIVDQETGDKRTVEDLELDEETIMNHIHSRVIDTGSTVYEVRHEIKNQMNIVFEHVQAFNKKYSDFPYILLESNGSKKTIHSAVDLPKELRAHLQENGRYVAYLHIARIKLMNLKFQQDESGQPVSTAKSTAL